MPKKIARRLELSAKGGHPSSMRPRLALLAAAAIVTLSATAFAEEPKPAEQEKKAAVDDAKEAKGAKDAKDAKEAKADDAKNREKKAAKKVRRVEKKEEAKREEAKKPTHTDVGNGTITAHGRPVVAIHIEKQALVFPPHTLVDPSGRPVD